MLLFNFFRADDKLAELRRNKTEKSEEKILTPKLNIGKFKEYI